jgi:hypothetical protein
MSVLTASGADYRDNLSLALTHSTCKIVGESRQIPGKQSVGTGFLVVKGDSTAFRPVLITAEHVLTNTIGDVVTMTFRRSPRTNEWERADLRVRIRSGEKILWAKHPRADVAAMYLDELPKAVVHHAISTNLLVTDDALREWEITVGQELLCLGYPLGLEANKQGFPILRSGKISSFPILPTKITESFLFDFAVFGGNSGGPVYLYQHSPVYGGRIHVATTIRGIVGIVTQEGRMKDTPLSIGRVIHASFIRELIESMP